MGRIRNLPIFLLLLLLAVLGVRALLDAWQGRGSVTEDLTADEIQAPAFELPMIFDPAFVWLSATQVCRIPFSSQFTTPLGSENAALTYDAQPFLIDRHLGSDLNGIGGWNSDLGDPVFSAASGLVGYSGEPSSGWGNFLAIAHRSDQGDPTAVVQTVYAHLDSSIAYQADLIDRGQKIGTVGTAGGTYLAHLHFEARKGISLEPGRGYHRVGLNRISPDSLVVPALGDPAISQQNLQPAPSMKGPVLPPTIEIVE